MGHIYVRLTIVASFDIHTIARVGAGTLSFAMSNRRRLNGASTTAFCPEIDGMNTDARWLVMAMAHANTCTAIAAFNGYQSCHP